MQRPGVMLYFDLIEPFRQMTSEQQGKMLMAILEYGQYGVVPELEGVLSIVWGFIRPRVDADARRYDQAVLQKKYAAYCRKAKDDKLSFEDWLSLNENGEAPASIERPFPITADASRSPTTATETTAETNTKTNSYTKTESNTFSNTDSDPAIPARPEYTHRLTPPLLKDVWKYCLTCGYTWNAEEFLAHFNANGWTWEGKPILDWKAAARLWKG